MSKTASNRLGVFAKLRLIWRSLWIQVLLNYKTMQGAGYLFILWPWLKRSEHRKNRVIRASGFLNGHPVFSSFALGAMLRRLSDGDAEKDPQEFDQWRESLSGPLGMVGDSLIWERWKPIVLCIMVYAMGFQAYYLYKYAEGYPKWIIALILITLLLYNLPLIAFRWWALDKSYESGKKVLTLGSHSALPRIQRTLDGSAAFVAGLVFALGMIVSYINSSEFFFVIAFVLTFVLIRLNIPVSISVLAVLLAYLGIGFIL
jgi:mannose/fructose/N-acetylgalactosamine-specific phosphotransferase system component IID